MSVKLIKALKTEKNLKKTPSMDFYSSNSSSMKNILHSHTLNENLTILQKNLEATQINFLGEKQQKLEKLSQIQELYEKNQELNKNLSQAAWKIKKKNEMIKQLEYENKMCKRLIEEIGIDYEKGEPFVRKIEQFESEINEKNKEIQTLREELIKKNEEITVKLVELKALKNVKSENENLNNMIKKKEFDINFFSEESNGLKATIIKINSENEANMNLNLEKIKKLEQETNEIRSKYDELNTQNISNQSLVDNLTQTLITTEIQLSDLKPFKLLVPQLENDSRKKDKEILLLNKHIIDLNEKIKPFMLKKNENMKNLLCNFCKDPIEDAITVIPCGHSYCSKCEIGYNAKKCKYCGCSIEAIYKNDLMNEMKKWFLALTQKLSSI